MAVWAAPSITFFKSRLTAQANCSLCGLWLALFVGAAGSSLEADAAVFPELIGAAKPPRSIKKRKGSDGPV